MQPNREILYRQIIIILLILMFGSGAFWYFSSHKENKSLTSIEKSDANWYSVKLINGEIYYGEIENTASDPVVLKNVYYNYDQINPTAPDAQKKEETASLRLVKRGNETHGPDGNMEIVRTQVVLMEQLKPESKVLKAILDYEK